MDLILVCLWLLGTRYDGIFLLLPFREEHCTEFNLLKFWLKFSINSIFNFQRKCILLCLKKYHINVTFTFMPPPLHTHINIKTLFLWGREGVIFLVSIFVYFQCGAVGLCFVI